MNGEYIHDLEIYMKNILILMTSKKLYSIIKKLCILILFMIRSISKHLKPLGNKIKH